MNRKEILQYLKENKTEFQTRYGVRKIGLFGSYARGENSEESDIDIVVELERPDLLSLVGIKQTIEEHLKVKVDIVRYRQRMNRMLKKRIERDAKYVKKISRS